MNRGRKAGQTSGSLAFLHTRKGYWPELTPGYLASQKKRLFWWDWDVGSSINQSISGPTTNVDQPHAPHPKPWQQKDKAHVPSCHAPPDVVLFGPRLHLHHRAHRVGLADGGREALREELPNDLVEGKWQLVSGRCA